MLFLSQYLLVFIVSAPVGEVVDHVEHSSVVTDDVKVAVIYEGPVVLKAEGDVIPAVVHEVVDHGEVDVAGVGELQVTDMEGTSKYQGRTNISCFYNFSPTLRTPSSENPRSCPPRGPGHRWRCCSSKDSPSCSGSNQTHCSSLTKHRTLQRIIDNKTKHQ